MTAVVVLLGMILLVLIFFLLAIMHRLDAISKIYEPIIGHLSVMHDTLKSIKRGLGNFEP